MYLLNINISYLKRWSSGLRFAVGHKQSRVRDQQKSFFFYVSSEFNIVLILNWYLFYT